MRTSTLAVALSLLFPSSSAVAATSGAVISVSPTSYTIAENAGPVPLVKIVRTGDVTTACSLFYSITGGGVATAADQFLSFAPYQTTQTITITPINDSQYTGPRAARVTLDEQSVDNAKLGDSSAGITVVDDEAAPPINVADISISEGNSATGTATFTAEMNPALTTSASFNWSTQNDTATAGNDYVAASGTVTFNAGETTKTFTVQIKGDTDVESDEAFRVNLTAADPAVGVARPYAVCKILNDDFNGAPPPVSDSLTPRIGSVAGGTDVTVTGSNFVAPCTALLGGEGVPVPATVVSPTQLTFKTAAHTIGNVSLSLTCGGKSATKPNAFRYTATLSPSLTPASGSSAGGTYFRVFDDNGIGGDCSVFFDDVPARGVKPESPMALIGVTPPHAAGNANVTLRCPGASPRLADHPFAFVTGNDPAPTVNAVSPNISRPGIDVRVFGANFRPGDSVLFGATAAPVFSTTPDTILVHVPDLPAASYTINVMEPAGRMSAAGVAFTLLDPSPTQVRKINPSSGAAGSLFDIEGLGFRPIYTFGLGTKPLQTVSTSLGARATVRVPPGFAAGGYPVTLLDMMHIVIASGPQFTVTASSVAIDSVVPGCATSAGGVGIEAHGGGFTTGLPLFIGHVPATNVTVVDPNTIRATAPAGEVGAADVSIRLTDGTFVVLPAAFRYVSPYDADGGCAQRLRPGAK